MIYAAGDDAKRAELERELAEARAENALLTAENAAIAAMHEAQMTENAALQAELAAWRDWAISLGFPAGLEDCEYRERAGALQAVATPDEALSRAMGVTP